MDKRPTAARLPTPVPPPPVVPIPPPASAPNLRAVIEDDQYWLRATRMMGQVGEILIMTANKEAVRAATAGAVSTAQAAGPDMMEAAAAAVAAFTRVAIINNGVVNGRQEWELAEEVRYTDAALACTLVAAKGYKFDLASVPRPLWSIIAPFQLSTLAPLFHDLIYEHKGIMPKGTVEPFPRRPFFTQRDADDLFYRLMEAEGVSYWQRQSAYVAVRSAGWSYWNF